MLPEHRFHYSVEAWKRILAKAYIGGSIPIEFCLTDKFEIKISMNVPEIKSGMPTTFVKTRPMPVFDYEQEYLDWLRKEVHYMYRHEADEQFYFGTTRPFLPAHEHEDCAD